MMECSTVREKLSFYLDGVIDEHTLEHVEAHLGACAECRSELASLAKLMETIREIPEIDPPAALKSRILDAVRGAEPRGRVSALLAAFVDRELPREMLAPGVVRWAAGAVAAAVIVLGLFIGVPHSPKHPATVVAEKPQSAPAANESGHEVYSQPKELVVDVREPVVEKPRVDRRTRSRKPTGIALARASVVTIDHINVDATKPKASPAVTERESKDAEVTAAKTPELEMPEPVIAAAAPTPAPVIETMAATSHVPTLIKAASAPAPALAPAPASAPGARRQSTEDWVTGFKAKAAMRKGASQTGGFAIVSAKF